MLPFDPSEFELFAALEWLNFVEAVYGEHGAQLEAFRSDVELAAW